MNQIGKWFAFFFSWSRSVCSIWIFHVYLALLIFTYVAIDVIRPVSEETCEYQKIKLSIRPLKNRWDTKMMIKNSQISLDLPIKNSLKFIEIALMRKKKKKRLNQTKNRRAQIVWSTHWNGPPDSLHVYLLKQS